MKIFFSAIFSLAAATALPQKQTILNIGDTVPDVTLKMINYDRANTNLCDFKGELILLDFWSTWCSSCIAHFSYLDSMQKQFGDKISVVPITGFGTAASNMQFFEKRKALGKAIALPSAVEDNFLYKILGVNGVPYEVWLDKNRVIRAITDQYAVTVKNINAFVANNEINLPVKRYQADFDFTKLLLVDNNGGTDSDFVYRSMITGYNDKIRGEERRLTSPLFTRLLFLNASVVDLYKIAYTHNFDTLSNLFNEKAASAGFKRVIVQNNDSLILAKIRSLSNDFDYMQYYRQHYLHCYELVLPSSFNKEQAYDMMIVDLDRFFNIKSSIQQRVSKTIVLKLSPGFTAPADIEKDPSFEVSEDRLNISMQHCPLTVLVNYLNQNSEMPFIVDSSDYEEPVNINIHLKKLGDTQSLKTQLHEVGIDILIKDLSVNMLVLEQQEAERKTAR